MKGVRAVRTESQRLFASVLLGVALLLAEPRAAEASGPDRQEQFLGFLGVPILLTFPVNFINAAGVGDGEETGGWAFAGLLAGSLIGVFGGLAAFDPQLFEVGAAVLVYGIGTMGLAIWAALQPPTQARESATGS